MDFSQTISIIVGSIAMINILFIGFIIFYERKSPVTAIAWILALTYIPVLGFLLYIVFGGGKQIRLSRIFRVKRKSDEYYSKRLLKQVQMTENQWEDFKDSVASQYPDILRLHMHNSGSFLTRNNCIRIYTDGETKFNDLIKDINHAKRNIHLSYFIFENDGIGNKIVKALTEKAKDGVEVRLLYDGVGSPFTPFRMFNELIASGGQVLRFLPSKLGIININANYRNHRKIAVIDGIIGYIGGMNIGDEYMGLHKKLTPWRDTHLRLTGSSVHMLQQRFLMDWAYTSNESTQDLHDTYWNYFFPASETQGNIDIQIVSSGPDTHWEEIKTGFIKMIYSAKHSIHIQTPYFIPDAPFLEALKIASQSGVSVKIMLPGIADKRYVFHGTNSYIHDLLNYGVKVYIYNGFLHSKVLVMDDKITSIGTTNVDIRSFTMNFEINAFIYDQEFSLQNIRIFEEDEKNSRLVTMEQYNSRPWSTKVKESICRLLSPVL